VRTVRAPAEAAGDRLDRFVAALPDVGTRSAAERLLAEGVLVDGERRPKSFRLQGEEVIALPDPPAAPEPKAPPQVQAVYEDEHLLVVDKPAGVVVHPGAGHRSGTLADALSGRSGGGDDPERPGIVHRLDRDTSGLLVVARTEEAYRRLQALVRRRALERGYLALVRGRPRSRAGRIEAPIGRDRRHPTRISLDTERPRDAATRFEIEEQLERHTLLRVHLETGRMHQIRVHLAAIGLPVVGDQVYGVLEPGLGRQFLHAATLAFPHPMTGERIEAESPLPPDLATFLDRLP